jgi:FMN reductase
MTEANRQVAVVVGNPKPQSRTLSAACHLARELAGADADLVVDLAGLGTALLDRNDQEVDRLVTEVGAADLVVVASPTYKASITGLLKLFLDRFPSGGLTGIAVPLMLGAGPGHALAPEYALRPVLAELGALTPVSGLYVRDSEHADPTAYEPWLSTARPVVDTLLRHRHDLTGVPA